MKTSLHTKVTISCINLFTDTREEIEQFLQSKRTVKPSAKVQKSCNEDTETDNDGPSAPVAKKPRVLRTKQLTEFQKSKATLQNLQKQRNELKTKLKRNRVQ